MRRILVSSTALWFGLHATAAGLAPIPALAANEQAQLVGQAQTGRDAFDHLGAATRLTIRFRDNPELSGDYRVSAERSISIPVIGRISVAGLDLVKLEQILAQRATEIGRSSAYVTVEIASFRTLFVTGALKNPGAIEWQPNMTVLQAVAVAGGLAPEFAFGSSASPVTGVSPQFVHKSVDTLKRDLAKYARLKAERDEATKITVPRELLDLVGPAEAERLVAAEADILRSNRETLKQKLEIVRKGIAAEQEQIKALRGQMGHIKQQLDARKKHLSAIAGLHSRGVVTNERMLEQEIKVSDLQEKIANIDVGIAKSVASLATLSLSEVSIERDNRTLVMDEISKIERATAQVTIDVNSARAAPPTDVIPTAKSNDGDENGTRYQIIRENQEEPIAATSSTLLRPGDVLVVARR